MTDALKEECFMCGEMFDPADLTVTNEDPMLKYCDGCSDEYNGVESEDSQDNEDEYEDGLYEDDEE